MKMNHLKAKELLEIGLWLAGWGTDGIGVLGVKD